MLAWEKRLGRAFTATELVPFGRVTTRRPQANWDRGYQISGEEAILVGGGFGINGTQDWREYDDDTRGIRICLVPLAGAK